jgi:hypothetical protein
MSAVMCLESIITTAVGKVCCSVITTQSSK